MITECANYGTITSKDVNNNGNGEGAAMADAISAAAATNTDMYTVADGIANKLFVAYAAYTK